MNNNENKKVPFKEILKTLGLFAISFAVIITVAKTVDSLFLSKNEAQNEKTLVTCPRDLESYEKTAKRVVLTQDGFSSYNSEGKVISIKRTGLRSKIACGYLLYKVSVDNSPIDQRYSNLVMGPVDSSGGIQFGGHILPEESTWAYNENIDNKTVVIIPLNDIAYDGTSRVDIKRVDWVSILNSTDQIDFKVALNTDQPGGKVDYVEIAYKCYNPETGEETQDCDLK